MQDRTATQERPTNGQRDSSPSGGAAQPSFPTADQEKLLERIHALEVAQATQAAVQAGAAATTAATQAGTMSTTAAAQAGTWAAMVAGATALVVGVFLGLAISRSHKH